MTSKPKRPTLVTLLAGMFLWIGCLGSVFFPLFLLTGLTGSMWDEMTAGAEQSAAWIQFLVHFGRYPFLLAWFAAYVAYAFIGFGLWKLRNWARKAVIGLSVFSIAASPAIAPFLSKATPVPLLIASFSGVVLAFGWIIWYLRRPPVRFAFGAMTPAETLIFGTEPPRGMSKAGKSLTALALAATFALFVGALLVAVEDEMHRSQVYALTMSEAEHSPCVASRIGQPLTPGWMVSGNMEESNVKGLAHLSIPVSGQKGKGNLVVSAEKQDGTWTIEELVLNQRDKKSD